MGGRTISYLAMRLFLPAVELFSEGQVRYCVARFARPVWRCGGGAEAGARRSAAAVVTEMWLRQPVSPHAAPGGAFTRTKGQLLGVKNSFVFVISGSSSPMAPTSSLKIGMSIFHRAPRKPRNR